MPEVLLKNPFHTLSLANCLMMMSSTHGLPYAQLRADSPKEGISEGICCPLVGGAAGRDKMRANASNYHDQLY